MLRGANVEIIQLEPGPLRGHHLRVGLPGGEISWIVTNLPLRGRGSFPAGIWTLSVVTGVAGRALQHGVEVSAGTQFVHGPGAEQDGTYGRDFSVVCLCLRDEIFLGSLTSEFPELEAAIDRQWLVSEPSDQARTQLIEQFEQAAVILRTDEEVRRSFAAKLVMQDELLGAFLESLAGGVEPAPMPAIANAAALVSRAEAFAKDSGINPSCVSDLCLGCGVPRRTLSHAFHQVLGMGPATYLRRLRLNQVRRALRQFRASDRRTRVKSVALEHGFWHPGRFSSQYRELFGESPLESMRRTDAG
jgi:AraC family ethanolamine operon transcriptional activator